jgi:aminoglycoside phosphotransferase (APT) family kinase protein
MTPGVVRVGATVRRPATENSTFVRSLLALLRERGFEGAPRFLGEDEAGREVFSFIEGEVAADLDATIVDQVLVVAARQIRRYHDATAGSELAGAGEVVCHNDLSPCNFVFREGVPVGIIDFDGAAPGTRLQDLGYALFLWLNLGTDGPELDEQARRIRVFCGGYGIEADVRVAGAIVGAVAANVARLRRDGRPDDASWWQAQLDWLEARRGELDSLLAG